MMLIRSCTLFLIYQIIPCKAFEVINHIHSSADGTKNGDIPPPQVLQGSNSEESKPLPHSDLSKLLIPSLFPNVPPYIKFALPNEPPNILPQEVRDSLVWKPWKLSSIITRRIITNTGYSYKSSPDNDNWLGVYTGHYNSRSVTKTYQKLNQVPGRGALEFKTKMWRNIKKLQEQYGKEELSFVPETYILPYELQEFKDAWDRTENKLWIEKTAGGARSRGIKLISNWNQVNQQSRWPRVIQKYIQNPYVIDGVKTQIRLFAMATSFNPLRLFVQREIFLKFGVANYTDSLDSREDLCIHSTDFGRDYPSKCQEYLTGSSGKSKAELISRSGNENSVRTLMMEKNMDYESFRNQLEDMVIKTVIAAEYPIAEACSKNLLSRYNAYQFWAIDFALDENFRPYLLELNSVPAMHSRAKGVARLTVSDIKSKAIAGLFTIAGFQLPPTLSEQAKKLVVEELHLNTQNPTFIPEMYTYNVSESARRKHEYFDSLGINQRSKYLEDILENLTPDDVRQLVVAEDELNRAVLYKRVFPSEQMYKYMKYVESKPYYYMLIDAWETKYGEDRLAGISRLSELTKLNFHLQP